jgi:hypothetical protein
VSIRARNIVAAVLYGPFATSLAASDIGVGLIRQGDMHEHALFRRHLVEDSSAGVANDASASENMSYVDFLCHVHRLIQQELAQ